MRAALFDKTGTITFGTPIVEKVVSLSDRSEESLLYLCGDHRAILLSFHCLSDCEKGIGRGEDASFAAVFPRNPWQRSGRGGGWATLFHWLF